MFKLYMLLKMQIILELFTAPVIDTEDLLISIVSAHDMRSKVIFSPESLPTTRIVATEEGLHLLGFEQGGMLQLSVMFEGQGVAERLPAVRTEDSVPEGVVL